MKNSKRDFGIFSSYAFDEIWLYFLFLNKFTLEFFTKENISWSWSYKSLDSI